MKYAVARMDGRRQRFFSGRFGTVTQHPITTGHHDRARAYDDEAVAKIVCAVLNLAALTLTRREPWAVLPLPEARK